MKPQIYIEEKIQDCVEYVVLHPGADCSQEQLDRALDVAGKPGHRKEMDHQGACRLARLLQQMGYSITMDSR